MSFEIKSLRNRGPRWASFGQYRLDLSTNELWRRDEPVALPEQAARVLKILVLAAGELVAREAICERIWRDRVVEYEAGLNTAIRQIRRALGDDAAAPRYIETLARRGYRFIPAVTLKANGDRRRARRVAGVAAAIVIAGVVGTAAWLANSGYVGPRHADPAAELARLDSPGYDAYLRGQFAVSRGEADEAETQLREAIALDPELAPAYVVLAWSLVGRRAEGFHRLREARQLVDEALRIEPGLSTAHILDAGISLYYFRDLDRAARSAATARRLAPGEPRSYIVSGYLETILGNHAEALRMIARAHELSPLSPRLNADYGWMHYKARNFDDAERLCRTSVELNPDSEFALECVLHVNHSQGDHAEAAEAGLRLMKLRGASRGELAAVRDAGDAAARERGFWSWNYDWAVNENSDEHATYSDQAIALTMLGRYDEAIAVAREGLERGTEPFFAFVAVDPRLDELRRHEAFVQVAAVSRTPMENRL